MLVMTRAEQTRLSLQDHAIRLFVQHGFDNVTVEEVARAAGVSHMTFFRYFPKKESVVLDDPYDPVIGGAVARQDPGLPALERVCLGVLESWDRLDEPGDEMTRIRIRLAAGHRSLRARIWENNFRTEEIIVEALTGTGVKMLEARVAAGAVLGALTAALFDWAEDEAAGTLGDRIRRALGQLATGDVESSAVRCPPWISRRLLLKDSSADLMASRRWMRSILRFAEVRSMLSWDSMGPVRPP